MVFLKPPLPEVNLKSECAAIKVSLRRNTIFQKDRLWALANEMNGVSKVRYSPSVPSLVVSHAYCFRSH